MNLVGRDFLKLLDFSGEEMEYLLDLAADLKERKKKRDSDKVARGEERGAYFREDQHPHQMRF